MDVEDPENPLVAHLAPSFRAEEEFYQFRSFSRDNVRVLLTLDTRGLDPPAADVPLVWVRNYGSGRVFYSAFGHFPLSFQSPPLRAMLRQALLWLTGQLEAPAAPARRDPSGDRPPLARPDRVDLDRGRAPDQRLLARGRAGSAAVRLAGTRVEIDGVFAPLLRVSPGEIVAQLPATLDAPAALTVWSGTAAGDPVPVMSRATRRRR